IAELSNNGSGIGAVTSSATGRPLASTRFCSKTPSGSMAPRTRSRCSSTEIGSATEHLPGRDPLCALVALQRDVAGDPDPVLEGPVTRDGERRRGPQRRGAVGEALVELTDQLVEVRVEGHV